VVQRSDCGDQIKFGWLYIAGKQVPSGVSDVTGRRMFPTALYALVISVEADDLGYRALAQLAGEFAIAASHVQRAPAPGRDAIENQGLVPVIHRSSSVTHAAASDRARRGRSEFQDLM
jgi:hypothetical protein